ncbi:MAG: FhaA domain-containing protein [Selenomonas sp.]|nr:FhaA domain-containing protein [Selenomonas sp.]
MGLGKLENFLANHIEGFFNKRFASALELAEVMQGLDKKIAELGRGKERHVVPNTYVLKLSGEDYQKLCAKRVIDEIYAHIEKQVIVQDYIMNGKLTVTCQAERSRSQGTYNIETFFSESNDSEAGLDDVVNTIVLERPAFNGTKPLNLPTDYKLVSLTVVEGPDKDSYLEFGEKKIYIGRLDKNEVILTDTNASRMHAWIAYEQHRHVLYDAQSTNGTYVNDKRIESYYLKPGDKINIGASVLVYEVI